MELDDELCLCFHVSKRKVINFIRVNRPQRASQLSECFGAGTGCGWCRPFLKRLLQRAAGSPEPVADDVSALNAGDLPSAEDYAQQRSQFRKEKGLG